MGKKAPILVLLLAIWLPLFLYPARARSSEVGQPNDVVGERFPQFEGRTIRSIRILGLKRSRENVVRWMLGGKEGEPFHAEDWHEGIVRLYSTDSLYEIHTSILPSSPAPNAPIDLVVLIKDKWTIFPYVDAQGGGGSLSVQSGVFDENAFGLFTYISLGIGYLDGAYSYDAYLYQQWIKGTNLSLGLDFSSVATPISIQDISGNVVENYTWIRSRQQFLFGGREASEFRYQTIFDLFRDHVRQASPASAGNVYTGQQWDLRPSAIFGRVRRSDYLEQGREPLSPGVSVANAFGQAPETHSFTLTWKDVYYFPETINLAYFASYGVMSGAPAAYQFHLGGFDSVRGFSNNRIYGREYLRGNLEFRTSLLQYRWEILGLDRMVVQGCAFTDSGTMWKTLKVSDSTGGIGELRTRPLFSAGLGLRAIFVKFAGAVLRLDVAQSIYPNEGWNISFSSGQFF